MRLALALVSCLVVVPCAHAATIKVTTTNDELTNDGDCSLREAITSANENNSTDECSKGQRRETDLVKLKAAEYRTSLGVQSENANLGGDFDYTGGGKLTIQGAKGAETDIEGEGFDRVIQALGNAKSLRLERLQIDSGQAEDGGNVSVTDGSLVLDRVIIAVGEADGLGGGIYMTGDGNLRIKRSTLIANEAVGGGGLYTVMDRKAIVTKSLFGSNDAADGASRGGGAWFAGLGGAEITDTAFENNTTTSVMGGASFGAGIFGADIRVARSTFIGNKAEELAESVPAQGGALNLSSNSSVVNSTFFGNTSADNGGAFAGEGKLANVTFLANQAESNLGDHVFSQGDGVTLRNSILPGASATVNLCSGGEVTSKGFNVFTYDDGDCGTLDSDIADGGNAGLVAGAPADNGGFTSTIALTAGSVARNLVPRRNCKVAEGVDQRNFVREEGKRCDAGAFERGAKPKGR